MKNSIRRAAAGDQSARRRDFLQNLAILLLARLMSWFLREHYSVAFHGILGIVLASTLVIIPTEYAAGEILLSALCCGGGFLLAYLLDKLDANS